MTRLRTLIVAAAMVLSVACGNDGTTTMSPTPPAGETSFLTGTWQGTVLVHRAGEPDTTGTTTWTFELVPNTGRTTFRTTMALEHPWLPITTTLTTALVPASPGGQINSVGSYASPRGCEGSVGSNGIAQATTIEATFRGVDCLQLPATSVFSGTVTLTKGDDWRR